MATDKKEPLRLMNFGLAQHSYQTFNATVPVGTTKADLEDPHFWSHCKHKIRTHDEIRVVAEDSAYVACVFVTFCDAVSVYTKVLWAANFDPPNVNELGEAQQRYQVVLKGTLKWCVVDTKTGKNIRTHISKKSVAERELEDYLRAIAA